MPLRTAIVNRARDQLLARTRFAGNQHGALGFGDAFGAPDHAHHGPAPPDDAVVIELFVAFAEQVSILRPQPLMIERTADDDQQFVDFERLLQIVERAELHRLDRAFHGGVRRHHHHLRPFPALRCRTDALGGSPVAPLRRRRGAARIADVGPAFAPGHEFANQVEAARLRHDVVDDEDVERPFGEQPERLTGIGRFDDFMSRRSKRAPERLQDFFLVVHEEDRSAMSIHVACTAGPVRPAVESTCSRGSVPVWSGSSIVISVPRPGALET